jgi:hypothetical protein
MVSPKLYALPHGHFVADARRPAWIRPPTYQLERAADPISNRLGSGMPVLVIRLTLVRESYFTVSAGISPR